jgi:hypothetical protein
MGRPGPIGRKRRPEQPLELGVREVREERPGPALYLPSLSRRWLPAPASDPMAAVSFRPVRVGAGREGSERVALRGW